MTNLQKGAGLRNYLCKWFGWHLYKSGSQSVKWAKHPTRNENYYLLTDRCLVCGDETRWWSHESAFEPKPSTRTPDERVMSKITTASLKKKLAKLTSVDVIEKPAYDTLLKDYETVCAERDTLLPKKRSSTRGDNE